MSGESVDAQFERLLGPHSVGVAATARALRALVHRELAAPVEQVDFANKLLAIGTSERMRDLLFAIIPHSAHVNLQLADGVALPDPTGLVEGTGKRIRHVKSRSVEETQRPALRDIVTAQIGQRAR
jgi:hypothetical protein